MDKSETAFRTIGEVSAELGVPQHVLRYWETRFPQLRPVTRAGNRRYYRPADVALARRIHGLLATEGYTVRGVQQLLAAKPPAPPAAAPEAPAPAPTAAAAPPPPASPRGLPRLDLIELRVIRSILARSLDE